MDLNNLFIEAENALQEEFKKVFVGGKVND